MYVLKKYHFGVTSTVMPIQSISGMVLLQNLVTIRAYLITKLLFS